MSTDSIEYSASQAFAAPLPGHTLPRVFGSPGRYVQGAGVIAQAGHYLSRLGFGHSAVLLSRRCLEAEGNDLISSAENAGLSLEKCIFAGECSFEEIDRHAATLRALDSPVDSVIAVGGGKVVDAGRALSRRLDVPVAVIPSLASNDAPCAAVSVIYTPEGVTADAEIYDENPALVLVDTGIIAEAEPRFLVAGMGDALATWYEARACACNPGGVTVFGGRPTLAGTSLAQLCAETIYRYGEQALAAVKKSEVTDALENVVEANTLLSGLGYESGGLAVCHAVAQGYTVIDHVHRNYLHGEMVAMGVLAQLALENSSEEAEKAARFFAATGLPVHLGQLDMDSGNDEQLDAVVDAAMAFPFIGNMPLEVTSTKLKQAILTADRLGLEIAPG
ncbi:iron-containing alcohol dehydrogenase [Seongchinamella sediminis]|uniref:Glycerol dehydrogenase n=1 Tax=Seongchinamella sediminis TaxID=2283635 RepID=A0A3L7DUG1_9GAMM|nr:glycerol dehydrogenase [Seongchinamella sediminis]RLQ21208.1 iron-containing alcohol dehydrogenase [Seongchinamella sediminis]